MSYSSIFYVDPGLRSGWASYEVATKRFQAGIADPYDLMDVAERWTNEHAGTAALVGCEKFTVNAKTHTKSAEELHWPWELTGACRYLAHVAGLRFEAHQAPSAALRFATDTKLRAVGFYTPGREDHARDASRHLLMKLTTLRLITL